MFYIVFSSNKTIMEECDFGPVVVFPLDEKDPHFHMSCGIEEKEKILRIFGEFGLVVVRDIIPVEDVNDIEEVEERFFFSFSFFFFLEMIFFSSPLLSPPPSRNYVSLLIRLASRNFG